MGKAKLVHVGIIVNKLEESINFYKELLGLQLIEIFEAKGEDVDKTLGVSDCHQRIALLKSDLDGCVIELIKFESGDTMTNKSNEAENTIGRIHLCFKVKNIVSLFEKLSLAGIEFTSRPIKHENHNSYVFLRDPEGNSIELMQEHAED